MSRSLVDELDRHVGAENCAVFLRDQVKEELLRLMALASESTPAEAPVEAPVDAASLRDPGVWHEVA